MTGLVPQKDTDQRVRLIALVVIIAVCALGAAVLVIRFRLALT